MSEQNNIDVAKINAEINKMMAETANIASNMNKNSQKIDAEISKMMAETAKINTEAKFYPLVVAGGLGGAIAVLAGAIAKLL